MRPIHIQISGGEEYLGWARQKLAALELVRQAVGSPEMSRHYYLDNGVEVFIRAAENGSIIRIMSLSGSFICHPRDKINPGGTTPEGVAITPTYVYPLVDDDLGVRVFVKEDGEWSVSKDNGNYGNIDWKAPDNTLLTWKGPPSRHFPLDPLIHYPGLTVEDEVVDTTTYYTPFGPNIYSRGDIISCVPDIGVVTPKVLGAALNAGKLVTILGTNYRSTINPDGGSGGYYFEVWRKDAEWVRLGFIRSRLATVPFFFNASGNEARSVYDTECYIVTIDGDQATIDTVSTVIEPVETNVTSSSNSEEIECIGPRTEPDVNQRLEPGYHNTSECNIQSGGKKLIAGDYQGDTWVPVYATMSATVTSSYDIKKQGYSTWSAVATIPLTEPWVGFYYDPDAEVGSLPHVSYLCNPSFSSNCGSVDSETGEILSVSGCCNTILVTATAGSDETGESVTVFTEAELLVTPISLGGPSILSVGSKITASGGVGEYYFSSSNEVSLSVSGDTATVTSITCGSPGSLAAATITVTDSCGNEASIVRRIVGGVWVSGGQVVVCNNSQSGASVWETDCIVAEGTLYEKCSYSGTYYNYKGSCLDINTIRDIMTETSYTQYSVSYWRYSDDNVPSPAVTGCGPAPNPSYCQFYAYTEYTWRCP